jgi:hypothetical protein
MRYAAALLSATLLVAGCGGSTPRSMSDGVAKAATTTPTPTATPQSDAQLLQGLLVERARRIENGDAEALADTSTGPQAARDKHEANAARALNLEGVARPRTSSRGTGSSASTTASSRSSPR